MGGACGTFGGGGGDKLLVPKPEAERPEDLSTGWRIILKRLLKKQADGGGGGCGLD